MVAKYEVLARTFIEPMLVQKGSIIEYSGSPGPHLYPLNEEAEAAMEAWYSEEHPLHDKDGEPVMLKTPSGDEVPKMYRPHASFRRRETMAPIEKPTFRVVQEPPTLTPGDVNKTLAGLGLAGGATPYERPPADRVWSSPEIVEAEASKTLVLKPGTVSKRELGRQIQEEAAQAANLADIAKRSETIA